MGQHCVDCVRAAGGERVVVRTMGATRPIATYSLIAINVAIFLITAVQSRSVFDILPRTSRVFYEGVLFGPLVNTGEYWRILTSGFLHYSLIHIGLNMLTLYILGRDLEMAIGTRRFLGVYFTALFGGSAAVLLFTPLVPTAGASGAIYGLMGGLLIAVIKAKIPPGQIIGLIAINIVISLSIANISLWAHLGGLAFGAAATAGVLLAPQLLPEGKRNAAAVARIGWIAIAGLIVLALVISAARVATL